MKKSYRWLLDPPRSFISVEDEFPARGYRLRLQGATLEVEAAADGTEESARRLADLYVAHLRSHGLHVWLRTEGEFAAHIPLVVQADATSPTNDAAFVRRAIRGARNALLTATSDAVLKLCYTYRDKMLDYPETALFHAFKLVELAQSKFGDAVDRVPGLRTKIEYVLQAASDPRMDERHAPKNLSSDAARPLKRETAIDYTLVVLCALERHLQPEP